MRNRHAELKTLTDDFLGAFNQGDVTAIMAFFADNAVYEEFHGKINEGKAAIQKSFEQLFSGRFGTIHFAEDDTFIDAAAGKVMSTWLLTLDLDGERQSLQGLDLLYFDGDNITRKLNYAKAKAGLYRPV